MKLPPYPRYKDSCIDWLGKVPEHWEVVRNKVIFKEVDERSLTGGEELLTVSHITGVTPRSEKEVNMFLAESLEGYKKSKRGDLIVNTMWAFMGALGMTDYDGVVSPSYNVYRLRAQAKVHPKYLDYLYRTPNHLVEISRFSKGVWESRLRLYPDAFLSMRLALPHYEEQEGIVEFLGREILKIDELIGKQERLIALLQEKRQSLISHAVTKGIKPDAPRKDSGIAWLGEIPKHWEVTKVKYCFDFLDGRRIPLSALEREHKHGDYPYYGASGIIDWIDEYIFDEDLILVGEDGANLLNRSSPLAFIARGQYWVNNHAHILKPKDSHLVFWAELLEAVDFTPYVTGSAQPKLTIDALANVTIAVPTEQDEIAEIENYIKQESCELEALTKKARLATGLLREHRTALIISAVTGKIDVRQNRNGNLSDH